MEIHIELSKTISTKLCSVIKDKYLRYSVSINDAFLKKLLNIPSLDYHQQLCLNPFYEVFDNDDQVLQLVGGCTE